MKRFIFLGVLILSSFFSFASDWYNPLSDGKSYVSGRWWNNEIIDSYVRIPERYSSSIPANVWHLAHQTAGEYINFTTGSRNITIRYILTSKELQMWHMQSTGVSGVDLYLTNSNGEQCWCASSSRSFSDTVVFNFRDLTYRDKADFRLYLPLYNGVKFMEIGVDDGADFSFVTEENIQPIVVYGTSIAQGACASRPGMAWTNILHRRLGIPMVNLGFSGSGQLEDIMFQVLSEIPARVYIIDCMPNMVSTQLTDSIVDRISRGVKELRKVSSAPILLVEHDGYMNEKIVLSQKEIIDNVNSKLKEAYRNLLQSGFKNLYYMSKEEIGMDEDSQVDAVHATDYGMLLYAGAYQKKLVKILKWNTH